MRLSDNHASVGISSIGAARPAHETVTLAMALRYFAARDKAVTPLVSGPAPQRDCE
jgi:hypothetical protein